ncbi:hypothetical protein F5Y18DRAFT_246370 [Xylariaceae sp. FL1019]|nr:hypothetical protein F5Y18DRAFT_246370 [Xylariaceae sp. FL1019]
MMADASSDNGNGSGSNPKEPQTAIKRPNTTSYHDFAIQSSPSTSPSVNTFSQDMSLTSPFRRHLSLVSAQSSPSQRRSDTYQSDAPDGFAQDSRDVLIQRLNVLASKLAERSYVSNENINAMHARVDEMENALVTPGYRISVNTHRSETPVQSPSYDGDESSSSWDTPGEAIDVIPDFTKARAKPSKASKMSVAHAERIVAEAQGLQKGLESVLSNLRTRQEETERIQEHLVARAERAEDHSLELENELRLRFEYYLHLALRTSPGILIRPRSEFERKQGEMDMRNLQIQLKAIEVQCLDYMPENVETELQASIDVWREEWSEYKRKKARKREELTRALSETPTRSQIKPKG